MEKKENSKAWQNWVLLGWAVLLPTTILSAVLIALVGCAWFYAVPMAASLNLMAWVGMLKVMFS